MFNTISMMSAAVIGCDTFSIEAVVIFLAGSNRIQRIDFPNGIFMLVRVSAALVVVAVSFGKVD